MNYFVKRGDQEYGPYSLADLQLYVQQGNVAQTDKVRSEGMSDWAPVSSVIGTIPVQAPHSGFGAVAASVERVSLPPNMHWAVLLLLSIVTCGLFGLVWYCIQAAWVRKVRPSNFALFLIIAHIGLSFAGGAIEVFESAKYMGPLFRITGIVLYVWAAFSMKSAMEDYFNREENTGMTLSGIMTFFFSYIYFQYHFNEVSERRLNVGMSAHA
jgi:hypothetical protein